MSICSQVAFHESPVRAKDTGESIETIFENPNNVECKFKTSFQNLSGIYLILYKIKLPQIGEEGPEKKVALLRRKFLNVKDLPWLN